MFLMAEDSFWSQTEEADESESGSKKIEDSEKIEESDEFDSDTGFDNVIDENSSFNFETKTASSLIDSSDVPNQIAPNPIQPVDNLDNLQDPTQSNQDAEETTQPMLYNAPDYGNNNYQEQLRQQDAQIDSTQGALMTSQQETFIPGQQQGINLKRWHETMGDGGMGGMQSQSGMENYVTEAEALQFDQGLPFQEKKKKRFRW